MPTVGSQAGGDDDEEDDATTASTTGGSVSADGGGGSDGENASGSNLVSSGQIEGDHWYSSGVNWYPGGYFNPGNWPGVYTAANSIEQWRRGWELDDKRREAEIEADKSRTDEERLNYAQANGVLRPART